MTGTTEHRTIVVDESDELMRVRLDRPAVKNAIDEEMVRELHEVCTRLERSPKILVLSGTPADPDNGAPGVFASGADIGQLNERRREDALAGINSGLFDRIARLPLIVVAVLDGYALGGGAELAYAADFRIGTPELRMGNPETGLGIIAAAGATWRLRELVGEPLAKEILLAGRVLTGEECHRAGLLTSLVAATELDAAVDELLERIGRLDPLALRLTKSVFHTPREAHPAIDSVAQAVLFESEEKSARMQRFIERRDGRST